MAAKNITAFSFVTPVATGIINGLDISLVVPIATDVTALVATFTHTGASIAVGVTAQVTGVTANDFTSNVTYTVTASDATTQDYTVAVTVAEVTAVQIATLRRLIAEPTTTTYSDTLLINAIRLYPHMDEEGESYTDEDGYLNADWTATYDLNAAAADIWAEKAGALAHRVNFAADGGNYSVSNMFEQYMKQARYFRSRRMPSTARLVKSPKEVNNFVTDDGEGWIGNLPEGD